jgi:hypothetical protein
LESKFSTSISAGYLSGDTAPSLVGELFRYALKTTIILPDVRKLFDGTTDMTTSHLTNPAKDAGEVIGYSHSTRLSKNNSQVAGYARAPVGAGHAREPLGRGHGPLLPVPG